MEINPKYCELMLANHIINAKYLTFQHRLKGSEFRYHMLDSALVLLGINYFNKDLMEREHMLSAQYLTRAEKDEVLHNLIGLSSPLLDAIINSIPECKLKYNLIVLLLLTVFESDRFAADKIEMRMKEWGKPNLEYVMINLVGFEPHLNPVVNVAGLARELERVAEDAGITLTYGSGTSEAGAYLIEYIKGSPNSNSEVHILNTVTLGDSLLFKTKWFHAENLLVPNPVSESYLKFVEARVNIFNYFNRFSLETVKELLEPNSGANRIASLSISKLLTTFSSDVPLGEYLTNTELDNVVISKGFILKKSLRLMHEQLGEDVVMVLGEPPKRSWISKVAKKNNKSKEVITDEIS